MDSDKDSFLTGLTLRNPEKLKNIPDTIRVGVAGCGGLGSNIAIMLARAGVKSFVLVDYDKIELSNLNRQQFFIDEVGLTKVLTLSERLKKINPYLDTINQIIKLDESNITSVFGSCQIIIEAFDNVEGKSLLLNSFAEGKFENKFLVGASGLAGYGDAELIKTHQLSGNIFICGDLTSQLEQEGVLSTRVMLTAALQAHKVLQIIADKLLL